MRGMEAAKRLAQLEVENAALRAENCAETAQ